MKGAPMPAKPDNKEKRTADPYLDRRSGEDRRQAYDLEYFSEGGRERRSRKGRRQTKERREGCVRVSDWSSVCPKEATTVSEE
jgi:hypothetical protein